MLNFIQVSFCFLVNFRVRVRVSYRVRVRNSLPAAVAEAGSLDIFKSRLIALRP